MRKSVHVAVAGCLVLALGACSSGGGSGSGGSGEQVSYWLWDSNQVPAYQECAAAFTEQNPDITIKIEQFAWDDYWTKLTASFVGGSGPDVFVDHLSKYGEFAAQGQIVALDDLVEEDSVDTSVYAEGLVDPWRYADGSLYGLPKDWDTTAFFYNEALVADAGYTAEDLWAADWNPDDGGTFEQIVAHLTVDANGVRGDEAGFDKSNVAVYGLGINPNFEETGQMQWANFTGSLDWDYLDQNPWGTRYNFDDPEFQKTVDWFYGLADKGYAPAAGVFSEETLTQVGSGKVAMGTNGSWATGTFKALEGVDVGIAPGPVGRRVTAPRSSTASPTRSARRRRSRTLRGSGSSTSGRARARTSSPSTPSCSRRSPARPTRRWRPSTRRAGTSRRSSATARTGARSSRRSPSGPAR